VSGFLTDPVAKTALAPYVAIAEQSFVDATKAAGFVATGFVILGVIFSLLLPQTRTRTTGQRDAEPAGAATAGSS
jgi:hypothetical protein